MPAVQTTSPQRLLFGRREMEGGCLSFTLPLGRGPRGTECLPNFPVSGSVAGTQEELKKGHWTHE